MTSAIYRRYVTALVAGCVLSLTAHAAGNAFNPDASVNILTLYKNSTSGRSTDNGFALQEAEMQFTSDVDPYFRASALFSVARDNGEWGIDPEEVFAETTSLPYVTLKAGRFKTALGKHNQLHTHAFPFIDAPLINQLLLGEEGIKDEGLSAAVLLPLPWFSEVTVQESSGHADVFNSPNRDALATTARLKNLWDLSDSTTLEFGLSMADGENQLLRRTDIFGGDLTLKYRPTVGGKYFAVIWGSEFLFSSRRGLSNDAASLEELQNLSGITSHLQVNFAERWWAQTRFDYAGFGSHANVGSEHRETLLLGYVPSEFSGLRLQYDHLRTSASTTEHTVALQLNISIGAHPAHAY
ncbi:MAG: hypothetical protein JST16_05790 [Bdellovibrionales bacterium]|nr:hypothetical protein [Bdellovibrionales bacterium]